MDARAETCTRGDEAGREGGGGSWYVAQIKERLQTEPCAIVIIIEIMPDCDAYHPKQQYHFRFTLSYPPRVYDRHYLPQ